MKNSHVCIISAVSVLFLGALIGFMVDSTDRKISDRKARLTACMGTYTIWVVGGGLASYGYQANSYSSDGDLITFTNNCNGKKHITPKTSILEIKEN